MSGLRNPYPAGDLGVVAPGAYADLLLVDGNPLEDLTAVKQGLFPKGSVDSDAGEAAETT